MFPIHIFQNFADICAPKSFFLIPSWYEFLYKAGYVAQNNLTKACELNIDLYKNGNLDLSSITLIGLGILDIALRLAGLIAVGFVVYGGIQYVTSQGEPDRTRRAQSTIINALIGLGITVVAAAFVSFVGTQLSK